MYSFPEIVSNTLIFLLWNEILLGKKSRCHSRERDKEFTGIAITAKIKGI